ncbi:MAG: hypothetical protein ACI3X4_07655 [Bacteroidaceae bacterium]
MKEKMDARGTKENPYSWEEYDEMVKGLNWLGGWVMQAGDVVYITSSGHIEKDYGKDSLGSISNPFSETAYNEMHARGDWPGGYVSFGSVCEYRRSSAEENADASGCGSSGSGSDFGSGSGSGSGSDVIAYIEAGSTMIDTEHFRVDVHWSAGSTIKGNNDMSRFEVRSITQTDPNITVKQILISWDSAYTIKLEILYVLGSGDSAVDNRDSVTVKV